MSADRIIRIVRLAVICTPILIVDSCTIAACLLADTLTPILIRELYIYSIPFEKDAIDLMPTLTTDARTIADKRLAMGLTPILMVDALVITTILEAMGLIPILTSAL